MTQPSDPAAILAQINAAREQTYQNIAVAQGILDQANAAASAAARDRAAIQAIAQQTVRVDTTVGTRVFAGDTMIFGDTGWRKIQPHSDVASGDLTIRRIGNTTFLYIFSAVFAPGTGFAHLLGPGSTVPDNFRARSGERSMQYIGASNNSLIPQRISIWDANVTWVGRGVDQVSSSDRANLLPLAGTVSWLCEQAWPTSLPGTPA